MIKKINIIILAIVGLLLLSSTIFYGLYLTPQKRAAAHLEYIHRAIDEVHPAVLDKKAIEFRYWHIQGYEEAKKLLPQVKTGGDANAILRFYLNGYEDSHLGGNYFQTPYDLIDSSKSIWTGWTINATHTGYFVQLAKPGDLYPPKNAQLLSCDQTPIDALLQNNFSPYFDRRWHLLTARQEAARAFSQRHNNVTILNRPDIKECTFEVKGTKKSYPFRWQPRDEKDIAAIRTINNPTYKSPGVKELSPGVLWITASDFRLNSTEANQRQQQLLNDLENFKTKKVIIFDTRLNAGGSSSHGFNIISRALDDDEKNYIFREWDLRFSGADAEFRASWRLYWNWDYKLQHVLKTQGPNSSPAKFLSAAKNKVKKSLENGRAYFKQSEIFEHTSNDNNIDTKDQSTEWKSSKQIVLLTSSRCSSACLDFVDMAKLIPGLIHVGEPTNADTSYIEVAEMQSRYFGEIFEFMVPAKKWNKRMRQDNIPYIPDIIYAGNIYDDLAVESWVLEQIQAIPQQAASN